MSCAGCGRDFVSDRTPMADAGICLFCRPGTRVTCRRCAARCPGAYDGQELCPDCRVTPLGQQQYEDKQHALIADLRAAGLIT